MLPQSLNFTKNVVCFTIKAVSFQKFSGVSALLCIGQDVCYLVLDSRRKKQNSKQVTEFYKVLH